MSHPFIPGLELIGRFAQALMAQVGDADVLAVARLGLVGSVDLFSDNTDLRSQLSWQARLHSLLDPAQPVSM
jgi:hypothetical protein